MTRTPHGPETTLLLSLLLCLSLLLLLYILLLFSQGTVRPNNESGGHATFKLLMKMVMSNTTRLFGIESARKCGTCVYGIVNFTFLLRKMFKYILIYMVLLCLLRVP